MGAHHHNQPIQDNPKFVFDAKLKLFTIVLIVIGAVSLGLTYYTGSEHSHIRFWTNLLQNSVFFTGIAFASLFFIATHTVAWGGWQTIFKRIPEAMMMFMPVGIILLGLIALAVSMDANGTDFLYLWSDEEALKNDRLVIHKSAFLNPFNYLLTLVVIGLWTLFALMIRRLSLQQDGNRGLRKVNYEKIHMWSAIFLPIAGFTSAFAIWQWVMSVDPHWYSTLFAWYATVSVWVSAICLMYLLIIFLQTRGHFQYFTKEHTHDLGKYVFGFSVFWTYLWFSQFMLIWYANNGEETQYYFLRFEQFRPVFFLNLIINFVIPFLSLMMNSAKRAKGTLGFMAGLVLLGHWLDYYQMIKPGVWYNWEHAQHAKHEHGHEGHDGHEKGHEGHDGHEKGHEHNENKEQDSHKDHKEHSETYRLTEQDAKPVLTDFQGAKDTHSHDKNGHTNVSPDSAKVEKDSLHDHSHDSTAHAGHDHGTAHTDEHNHDAHATDEHAHDAHAHGPSFVMGIHFPGFYELGTMIGFLGLFLFVTFSFLSSASLMPKNDPYVDESKNHHVWYDL
jgi:hypothetical protein